MSNKPVRSTIKKILDVIAAILAVLLVLVYALFYINGQFHFIDSIEWLTIAIALAMKWGSLLLVAIVGVSAMIKRNLILFILYCLILAVVVVFMFFPGTLEQFLPKAS